MGVSNFSFSLAICFISIAFALVNPSFAQNAPQDYLDAHNAARAQVGVGAINWDDNLAAYAQNYADQAQAEDTCDTLVHSQGPYGENLAGGTGDFTGRQAVELWVQEGGDYDYESNSCAPDKVCGHYTQVVWQNSVNVGCARVVCANGWAYVICSYDPPGNVIGERPY
ncbi:OLC1v1002829C1 [Oldenlandia corymbosa var. corymbosa]|uniref:OLC1v1002829C1 n=1 Tax=Oldenlandia corymbosa var. corymbosa TaxID=529605 RepID=A0AAV1D8M8_OLDCO|nr:OLC1v1002829C1 [Oldenlandia corymbosa var. corymbosa]